MEKVGNMLYEKLYDSLIKYWSPLPSIWPTGAYLTDVIGASEEFKNYIQWREVNRQFEQIDLQEKTNDQLLLICVRIVTGAITDRWMTSQKEVYDSNTLLENYNRVTQNGTVVSLYYYDLLPNNLFEKYYAELEQKWIDKLYYKGGIYDLPTLDQMIPHIDYYGFSRARIMARYMEKMNQLKPRGEEWENTIEMLWDEVFLKQT